MARIGCGGSNSTRASRSSTARAISSARTSWWPLEGCASSPRPAASRRARRRARDPRPLRRAQPPVRHRVRERGAVGPARLTLLPIQMGTARVFADGGITAAVSVKFGCRKASRAGRSRPTGRKSEECRLRRASRRPGAADDNGAEPAFDRKELAFRPLQSQQRHRHDADRKGLGGDVDEAHPPHIAVTRLDCRRRRDRLAGDPALAGQRRRIHL